MFFSAPDTRLGKPIDLQRLLVFLSGLLVLVVAAPSLAGRYCVGPTALSNGPLNLVAMGSDAVMKGVVPEGASGASSWTFPICGAPNSVEPGFVPHGDPQANGMAVMMINKNRLTIAIDLGNQRYDAHHAHLYSTTSGYRNENGRDVARIGQSTVCWATSNLTPNDPSTSPYNEKSLSVVEWPYDGGYAEDFYRGYLRDIKVLGGGEWFVMVHMLGGHFAVDHEGHLIEWDATVHEVVGDADVAGNFGGNNDIEVSCNARHGRKLTDRRMRTGSACLRNLSGFNRVDDYFLDQNGVAWLDSAGDLTPDAIDHGYDLATEYLFFSFADEGRAGQYGGPEGGAGGFINGYDGSRCDDWPPEGWGEAHRHFTDPGPGASSAVAGLDFEVVGLSRTKLSFAKNHLETELLSMQFAEDSFEAASQPMIELLEILERTAASTVWGSYRQRGRRIRLSASKAFLEQRESFWAEQFGTHLADRGGVVDSVACRTAKSKLKGRSKKGTLKLKTKFKFRCEASGDFGVRRAKIKERFRGRGGIGTLADSDGLAAGLETE